MKKAFKKLNGIILNKKFQLGFNIFLGIYAIVNMVGAFWGWQTSTFYLGIWIGLAVFNSVMGDHINKMSDDIIKLQQKLIDNLIEDNKLKNKIVGQADSK